MSICVSLLEEGLTDRILITKHAIVIIRVLVVNVARRRTAHQSDGRIRVLDTLVRNSHERRV